MSNALSAPLPLRLKLAHGLGSIAYGVKDSGFSTFLLLFYNQVFGLPATMVSTALMLALFLDALIDPFIGHMSDRTHTRWGRRLPWLYTAAIPLGFAWLLLWSPPSGTHGEIFVYLVAVAFVVRALVSCCEVPSIALVPELTGDYDERTRLMRYRFLFGWAGGLLMLIFAYGIFFAGEKGVSDPDGYDSYSVWGALMMTGAVLISALGQHRHVAKQSPPAPRGVGLGHALAEVKATLSNKAFLWLVSAALFGLINQGMTFALSNYQLAFLWQLEQMEMLYYALILFSTVIIAFIIVPPISARLGKKNGAILFACVSLIFTAILYGSWLLGLVPGAPSNPSILFMFVLITIANSAGVSMMMLVSSMMADVVEASQQETGRRSEGLFFAGYFFMQKCAVGIGTFAAGMILSFAQFPQNAKPGQVDAAVLDGLALYYMGVVVVLGIIGVLILRHFPISRESHNERLRALNTSA